MADLTVTLPHDERRVVTTALNLYVAAAYREARELIETGADDAAIAIPWENATTGEAALRKFGKSFDEIRRDDVADEIEFGLS